MLFGAGLVAGLMQSIADGIGSHSLGQIAHTIAIALPFEALFQDGLNATVSDTGGITGALLKLGPFGGAHHAGVLIWPYTVLYVAGVIAAGAWVFARRDL